MRRNPVSGPDSAGTIRKPISIRAVLALVVASTVGIWIVNFAVFALGPDDARAAAERTVRAIPFISLAAVVVLVLLRH